MTTISESRFFFHQALLSEELLAQADPEHYTAAPALTQSYHSGVMLEVVNGCVLACRPPLQS